MTYPKRLIEVDLPIKRISEHARREKSIRHGHISTLHIWWARRPLAACRAVICAALWPDPVDELCPQAFRDAAADLVNAFAYRARTNEALSGHCSGESLQRWLKLAKAENRLDSTNADNLCELRLALLDFIADFANWDNSTVSEYLETARLLTQAAHASLSDLTWSFPRLDWDSPLQPQISNFQSLVSNLPRPLVVDPFAGGGAIPLEALRVGADAFASDLNPVAVLLNKVVLEYIPKYGQQLADEVRKWGEWIKEQAEKELAEFYPKDPDGATPIAYLWARTITCEGPGCGAGVPLMRSLWLAKRGSNSVALRLIPRPRAKRVDLEIIEDTKPRDVGDGTVKRGSATCPVCGYTTPVVCVRRQLKARKGGAADARLIAVVTTSATKPGRSYRLATGRDLQAAQSATEKLERQKEAHIDLLSFVPDETIPVNEIRRLTVLLYGMASWSDLFSPRQALATATLARIVSKLQMELQNERDRILVQALCTCLAIAVDRQADINSSVSTWHLTRETVNHTFARQALPVMWDFAEISPFSGSTGAFAGAIEWVCHVCENVAASVALAGHVEAASATEHPLPNDSANALITDPPYYDAVPYSHLSDFFYVWLRRTLRSLHPDLFHNPATPKDAEIVVDRPHELSTSTHNIAYYERALTKAFSECRRVLAPAGIATIVFASKTTSSWEAILQAVVDSGWIVTGSWPIDTEMEARVSAQGQARLASSIFLACRPREKPDGTLRTENIGEWRDVLAELPTRIHEWMPRLAREGVVGADAIFACLGPALEIFSRYSCVEKASGEPVSLNVYLEQVWGAVAREALNAIFEGADTSGFEEDARLTAIWFWVLREANGREHKNGNGIAVDVSEEDAHEPEDEAETVVSKSAGYLMEFDAARKLAQGLGADLTKLSRPGGIITIRGNTATLNAIESRETYLLGQQLSMFGDAPVKTRTDKKTQSVLLRIKSVNARQQTLFSEESQARADTDQPYLPSLKASGDLGSLMDRLLSSGVTTLDRLHQAMLLFGRSQTSLLGPFLYSGGIGSHQDFWRLAQALSALYPPSSDEKRWVDGVLARKKGLGF